MGPAPLTDNITRAASSYSQVIVLDAESEVEKIEVLDAESEVETESSGEEVEKLEGPNYAAALVLQPVPLQPLPQELAQLAKKRYRVKSKPPNMTTGSPLFMQAAATPMLPANVNGIRDLAEQHGASSTRRRSAKAGPQFTAATIGQLWPTFAKDRSYFHAGAGTKKVFILEVNQKKTKNHRKVIETIMATVAKHDLNKAEAVELRNELLEHVVLATTYIYIYVCVCIHMGYIP